MCACLALHVNAARADDVTPTPATPAAPATPASEEWAIHGQLTNITQKHSVFSAAYSGTNSLTPNGPAEETTDMTLFFGKRLWHGAEFWADTEIDQGFGFDNTLGIAGFPNGGAYKIGADAPYLRIPRFFIRQVIALGGAEQTLNTQANQLAGTQTSNNLTVTIGKFSVPDIFDTNTYAHDPRGDFLNWSVFEAGAFDYAADPWGYTYGMAAEWNQDWWTLRGGYFELSAAPNSKITAINFSENSTDLELEMRHQWLGHPGKIKLLTWINHAAMGSYQDAVQLGRQTGITPDVSLVRKIGSRPGVVLNMEQELFPDLGTFARYSVNRGNKETYEFSDINQSFSAGLSLKGDHWNRHDDTVGIGVAVNRLSGAAQEYFAAGGLGLLIGDGNLNYASEQILEMYYAAQLNTYATLTLDYQHVSNPAYNEERGPVSIYGMRLHASF